MAIADKNAREYLTIKNFNPIYHGGEYKCDEAKVKYYKELESSHVFKVKGTTTNCLKQNNNTHNHFITALYIFNVYAPPTFIA